MKRQEYATLAATKVATSIEAHLTGAVEAISLRNQGVSGDAVSAVQAVGHLICIPVFKKIIDFSFSVFKAKAFSFCLFFYPDVMPRTLGISNGQPMLTYVSMTPQLSFRD